MPKLLDWTKRGVTEINWGRIVVEIARRYLPLRMHRGIRGRSSHPCDEKKMVKINHIANMDQSEEMSKIAGGQSIAQDRREGSKPCIWTSHSC